MCRKIRSLSLLLIILTGTKVSYGQFKLSIEDYSIALSEVQYGVPFLSLNPINPGVEFGATFLKNEKTNGCHSIGANLGYFYHNIMASAPYIKANYTYQFHIKQVIGIDAGVDIGYLHAFYPGESYKFNKDEHKYESTKLNSYPAFTAGGFIGLTYIKPSKINPFIKYGGSVLNFSDMTTTLNLGIKFNF